MAKRNPLGGFAPGEMLTPVQIALLARKHWKNWKQVQNAVQIALRESGGSSRAHNPRPPDDSYGLWQLNFYGGQKANFSPFLATDPEASTKYAHQLFQSSGWDPWISPEYRMTDEIRQKALAAVRQAKRIWKQNGGDPNNTTPEPAPTEFAGASLTGVPTTIPQTPDFTGVLLGLMENINAFSQARAAQRMQPGSPLMVSQPYNLLEGLAQLRMSGKDGGLTADPTQPGAVVTASPQTTKDEIVKGPGILLRGAFSATHDTDGLPGYDWAYDHMSKPGTPVRAPASGKITRLSGSNTWKSGGIGGRSIYLDGKKYDFFLTHFAPNLLVKPGQWVKKGQVIGYVGNPTSGMAPHIHVSHN